MADQNQNPLLPTLDEDEQFVSSESFMNADTALDWDALVTRGNSNHSNQPLSKWERDSLYVKFDPLIASKKDPADRMSFAFKAPKPPTGPGPIPQNLINTSLLPPPAPLSKEKETPTILSPQRIEETITPTITTESIEIETPSPPPPIIKAQSTSTPPPEDMEDSSSPSPQSSATDIVNPSYHPPVIVEDPPQQNGMTTPPPPNNPALSRLAAEVIGSAQIIQNSASPLQNLGNLFASLKIEDGPPSPSPLAVQNEGSLCTNALNKTQSPLQNRGNPVSPLQNHGVSQGASPKTVQNHQSPFQGAGDVMSLSSFQNGTGGSPSSSQFRSLTPASPSNLSTLLDSLKIQDAEGHNNRRDSFAKIQEDTENSESGLQDLENSFDSIETVINASPSSLKNVQEQDQQQQENLDLASHSAPPPEDMGNSPSSNQIVRDPPLASPSSSVSNDNVDNTKSPSKIVRNSPASHQISASSSPVVGHLSPSKNVETPPIQLTPPTQAQALNTTQNVDKNKTPTATVQNSQQKIVQKPPPKNMGRSHSKDSKNPQQAVPKSKKVRRPPPKSTDAINGNGPVPVLKKSSESRSAYAASEIRLSQNVDDYIKQKERHDKAIEERDTAIEERNLAHQDLAIVEARFAEMLAMYEEVKAATTLVEKNCVILQRREEILTETIQKREARDQATQEMCSDVFEKMQRDFETRIKAKEAENMKLKAKIRMCEMKTTKLEGEVAQVDRESESLRKLCEDLTKQL